MENTEFGCKCIGRYFKTNKPITLESHFSAEDTINIKLTGAFSSGIISRESFLLEIPSGNIIKIIDVYKHIGNYNYYYFEVQILNKILLQDVKIKSIEPNILEEKLKSVLSLRNPIRGNIKDMVESSNVDLEKLLLDKSELEKSEIRKIIDNSKEYQEVSYKTTMNTRLQDIFLLDELDLTNTFCYITTNHYRTFNNSPDLFIENPEKIIIETNTGDFLINNAILTEIHNTAI